MKFNFSSDGVMVDFFRETNPVYRLIFNRAGLSLKKKDKEKISRYGRKVYAGVDFHKSKGLAYTEIHADQGDYIKLVFGFGKFPDQEPATHWRQRSTRKLWHFGPFYFCKYKIERIKEVTPGIPHCEKQFSRADWNREVDEWLDHVYVRIQQIYDSNPSMD